MKPAVTKASVTKPSVTKPRLERLSGECRNLSLRRHTHGHLGHIAQAGQLREQVGEPGGNRCDSRPLIDPPEGIGMNRANPVLPVVRKKFGLVGSHVHINWTIPFTPFTRQAKVQSFLYVLIVPPVTDDVAMQHFPKQMRS